MVTLSKFALKPGKFHFQMLKHIAIYLCRTKHWATTYHKPTRDKTLPTNPFTFLTSDQNLPQIPTQYEDGLNLTCFVDAAHANDLRTRRSTTGYAFHFSGGCISYGCKTQSATATSSTEAEFYAAVMAAKDAKYIRAILRELGFSMDKPTQIYCDNQSTIKMVNSKIPTGRSWHICIQWFAIQD